MNRILITGTYTFIGTNFRQYSENKIIEEISLRDNKPENIDFSKVDVLLHLAAIVHQSKRIEEHEYNRINRDLCLRVAELAKGAGVKQFIFLSSVKVYGKFIPASEPWNEDSECHPDDSYGKSKYEAEIALKNLEDTGFIVSIIRTPIVYGPGVKANMLRLISLIEKFPLLPFKNVHNNRCYTYIENLIGTIDRIIELKASGTFIVMDDSGLSTSDLVKYLAKYLHRNTFLFRVPDMFRRILSILMPTSFDRLFGSFYLDNHKTKEILNYKPPFTAEEGLGKMISFYLEDKKNRKYNDSEKS
jgi:nucleoside-diphosphate-sugar epimerase